MSNTTNDEQVKYGKEDQPKPLLSNGQMEVMASEWGLPVTQPMEELRDFYESKIASGELMVVKTATEVWAGNGYYKGCSLCGHHFPTKAKFCPGCGAKIAEG